jgi:protein-S-isoprenylcysteine O-methyltransferase Ste14
MSATLSLVRLQKLALIAREVLERNFPIALRLAGVHLKADQPLRGLVSSGVLTLGLLWVCDSGSNSSGVAIACFVAALALRFGFLFASFTARGVASRLSARLGVERGHAAYSMALDFSLFAQRASFIALAVATARDASGPFGWTLEVVGFVLVPVGVGATVWAARVVGLDAWYYRDLFTGSRSVSIENDGPYTFCPNPMYTLGPLAGYGLALLALSPLALFAAGVNQALLFAFNELVEQPRLRRAHSIFVETQRRYELARSLLGFDPRQELAQRVHLDPSSQPTSVDVGRLAI